MSGWRFILVDYIFNAMLALLSVTVVAGARFNVTEPIRGLLMGGTNL